MSTEYRSEPDGQVVCHTFYGGKDVGPVVDFGSPEAEAVVRERAADPFYRFVDEYGAVYTGGAFLMKLTEYTVEYHGHHHPPSAPRRNARYREVEPGVWKPDDTDV